MVLALSTSNCSAGQEPRPPTPETKAVTARRAEFPSSAPTPSQTLQPAEASKAPQPPAPSIPHDALQNSKAGALAFTRYYVTQINHAFSTPDAAAFDDLFAASCTMCSKYRATAEKFAADGQRQGSQLLWLTSVTAHACDTSSCRVVARFTQKSVSVLDKSNKVISRTSSGKALFDMTLAWNRDHWVVRQLHTVRL